MPGCLSTRLPKVPQTQHGLQTPLPMQRAGLRTAEAAAHAGGGWVRACQWRPGAAAAAAATAGGIKGGGAPRPPRPSWRRWRWSPAAQRKPALPRKAPVHAAGVRCVAVCALECVHGQPCVRHIYAAVLCTINKWFCAELSPAFSTPSHLTPCVLHQPQHLAAAGPLYASLAAAR